MVILRTRNKITDFLMILAWASPFNNITPFLFPLSWEFFRKIVTDLASRILKGLFYKRGVATTNDEWP